jgi:hypothetical protein
MIREGNRFIFSENEVDAEIEDCKREDGSFCNSDMTVKEKRAVWIRSYLAWLQGEAAFRRCLETDSAVQWCLIGCTVPDGNVSQDAIDAFVEGAMN